MATCVEWCTRSLVLSTVVWLYRGQCVEDSPWTDRRWVSTVLDSEGYLLLIGGDERNNNTGPRIPRNDVWRSSFSLYDNPALSRACGVEIPACGVGLTCTPSATTEVKDGKVTCPAIQACTSDNLSFRVITAHAPWPIRHSAGVEFLKKQVTVGTVRYSPGNSLVLYGGTGPDEELMTDVWLSSNGGEAWQQVAQTGAGFPGSAWSGQIIDAQNRIYKIGGERWGVPSNTGNGEVYMSTNAGVSWTRQLNTSRTTGLPPRAFPDTYVDSKDNIYVAAGLQIPGPGLNDVWVSSNQGRDWKKQGNGLPFNTPMADGGRSSASLLIHYSPVIQKEIMYYFGGFSRGNTQPNPIYHNDGTSSSTQHSMSLPSARASNTVTHSTLSACCVAVCVVQQCGSALTWVRRGRKCCMRRRGRRETTSMRRSPRMD